MAMLNNQMVYSTCIVLISFYIMVLWGSLGLVSLISIDFSVCCSKARAILHGENSSYIAFMYLIIYCIAV